MSDFIPAPPTFPTRRSSDLKISGGDFRIGMVANTLMLAGLCLAMILTARRIRGGQTRLADAFFPLALLHLGHWENMRSEEHTSELQSQFHLVCRLLLEKKKN